MRGSKPGGRHSQRNSDPASSRAAGGWKAFGPTSSSGHYKEDLHKATINAKRTLALAGARRSAAGMRDSAHEIPTTGHRSSMEGRAFEEVGADGGFAISPVPTSRGSSIDEQPEPIDHVSSLEERASKALADTTQDGRLDAGLEEGEGDGPPSDDQYVVEPLNPCLEFVEKAVFEGFIIAVITLNTYCLAEETDNPGWRWWRYLNGLFLIVYSGEIILRLLYLGPLNSLWYDQAYLWIWYELLLVILGVVDLVVAFTFDNSTPLGLEMNAHSVHPAPVTGEMASASMGNTESFPSLESLQVAPIARLLMISRLCRLFRVIRFVEPLRLRVQMLIDMLVNTMWWIFASIFVFCFILAIILTRLLGHGLVVNEKSPHAVEVKTMFQDIPTALFTLFQLTTVDDWGAIASPIISMSDNLWVRNIWRLFFCSFIILMSWTMLSLLTAVASETMISNTSASKSDEIVRQELLRQDFINFLCIEFMKADEDKNGVLDKDEFGILMKMPQMKQELKVHGVTAEEQDLMKMWDMFDLDHSGELTIEELVDGFSLMQEMLATKHVASIGYSLQRFRGNFERDMQGLDEGTEKLKEQQQEILQHTENQMVAMQEEWAHLWHEAAEKSSS